MIRKIVVLGNCQTIPLSHYLRASLPETEIIRLRQYDMQNPEERAAVRQSYEEADLIFAQGKSNQNLGEFSYDSLKEDPRASFFPVIMFSGFHPDFALLQTDDGDVNSAIGSNHSSIVVAAYKLGLSQSETVSLFNRRTYEELGFFEAWATSKRNILRSFDSFGLHARDAFRSWKNRGVFMHSPPHPCSHVIRDTGAMLLEKADLSPSMSSANLERYLTKYELDMIIWPCYPELAAAKNRAGELLFKVQDNLVEDGLYPKLLPLRSFVEKSFENYRQAKGQAFKITASVNGLEETMAILSDLTSSADSPPQPAPQAAQKQTTPNSPTPETASDKESASKQHPYKGLPKSRFWKQAVASQNPDTIDPLLQAPFQIDKNEKITTAGSCFAQHLARRLQKSNYSYFVSEPGPADIDASDARLRNYGVFSARYGNLYTARQFNQLFDRAYGKFVPAESIWQRSDGRLVDPFRPRVEPDGFQNSADLETDRQFHFAAVRQAFEQTDRLIFTLGLTEAWVCKEDGAVLPLAPGVAGGTFDKDRHEFVNFSAAQTAADLESALQKIKAINPGMKAIVTVSPVPLAATFENEHVLTASTLSKAALRVAAHEVCQSLDYAAYFPSYEIITSPLARGRYFDRDLRTVTPEGVDHVMRVFFKHFTNEITTAADAQPADAGFSKWMRDAEEIVCDEDAISG